MSRPHPGTVGPPQGRPPFRIRVDLTVGRLFLAGPLDHSTVHLLHDAISTLLLSDGDVWVVDASRVTTCDRAGIRAIGSAYRRALRHHRRMQLIGTSPSLQCGLTRVRPDHHLLTGDDGPAAVPDPVSA